MSELPSRDPAVRVPLPTRLRVACVCYGWAVVVDVLLILGLPLAALSAREAWNAFVLVVILAASVAALLGIVRRRRYFVRTSLLLGILGAFQLMTTMEMVAAVRGPAAASALVPLMISGSLGAALVAGMLCCLPLWSGRRGSEAK